MVTARKQRQDLKLGLRLRSLAVSLSPAISGAWKNGLGCCVARCSDTSLVGFRAELEVAVAEKPGGHHTVWAPV